MKMEHKGFEDAHAYRRFSRRYTTRIFLLFVLHTDFYLFLHFSVPSSRVFSSIHTTHRFPLSISRPLAPLLAFYDLLSRVFEPSAMFRDLIHTQSIRYSMLSRTKVVFDTKNIFCLVRQNLAKNRNQIK